MAARLLYPQRWKNTHIPTVEEWILKSMELVKMTKLTTYDKSTFDWLPKTKNLSSFISVWRLFFHFLLEKDKEYSFEIRIVMIIKTSGIFIIIIKHVYCVLYGAVGWSRGEDTCFPLGRLRVQSLVVTDVSLSGCEEKISAANFA